MRIRSSVSRGAWRRGSGGRIGESDGRRRFDWSWITDQGSGCLNFVQIDVMKITPLIVTLIEFSDFRKKSEC